MSMPFLCYCVIKTQAAAIVVEDEISSIDSPKVIYCSYV